MKRKPLSETHPELASQAVGWDPSDYLKSDERKKPWKCGYGHLWQASIKSRVYAKTGCPTCNNLLQKTRPRIGVLSQTHPQIATEANGWDPSKYGPGMEKRKSWICSLGHIWEATIRQRTKTSSGCPICSSHPKFLSGFNDLQTKYPELAIQAVDWDPSQVFPSDKKKRKWRCPQGHSYLATAHSRVQHSGSPEKGCRVCSSREVLVGVNDLASRFPELVEEADGWDPSEVTWGSQVKRAWKCKLGHSWKASPNERTNSSGKLRRSQNRKTSSCPYCSGAKVLKGFNDLSSTYPMIAAQASGWDPSTVTAKSSRRREWICESGHTWISAIASRTASESGCPYCAERGFNPGKDGWVYFLRHDDWHMFQIGITNVPKKRLKKHYQSGWQLVDLSGPMDGLLAQRWEESLLQMLRMKGVDLANPRIAGKFDGYTESWSQSRFTVKSLKDLMDMTLELESEK